jgi:hypothetical protein
MTTFSPAQIHKQSSTTTTTMKLAIAFLATIGAAAAFADAEILPV